jgi:hypothetical protein
MARDGYFTQYTTQGTYTGSMDEVVIYNRALNPTEIQNLYNLTNSYSVRDVGPSGGLIFYDKGSYSDGWRYLEAAQSDYNIPWSTASSYPVPGAIGITVGTGAQNTIDIVNGDPTNNTAADYCSVLVTGAYNNWFLPSKDELNLMYVNLKLYGVGGLSDGFYWSSSQYDPGRAWYQYFQNGTQSMDFSKGSSLCVRPIRAF